MMKKWFLTAAMSSSLILVSSSASADQLTLHIEGVEEKISSNVQAFLGIASLLDQSDINTSRLRYLHRQADEEIHQALEPFGYYNPDIDAQLTRMDDGTWEARYVINPGPQAMLKRVNIELTGEGLTDPVFQQAIQSTSLKSGVPLDQPAYASLKNRLQSIAAERGYYKAQFVRSRIMVDRDNNTAEVDLVYATQQRTRISEIRFADSPIAEDLLRRYPRFSEGGYLDVTQLIDLQSALIDSNYFSEVEVLPLLNELNDGEIPVQVSLTPRPRNLYRAGIGFGTDTGARMQLGMDRRYVNKRGHKLDANLRLSQIRNDITSSYMIPGQDPRFDQYGLRARYTDENSDTIDSQTFAIGGLWQKQIGDWERVLSLDLEQEQFTFDDDTQDLLLLIPRVQLNKTVADDRFNTHRGHSLGLGIAAASDSVISDISLLRLSVNGKRVDPMGEKWRLLTRFDVGALLSEDFDKVPASMRFYAGGDSSVRGYDYQTLGPESAKGNVIGGQYLMVGSVETDYMFRPDWRIAAFVDAGNAFDDVSEQIKTSAGFGVRWQSPVGPIRLDLAKPIDDDGFRIHFTLGPDL